MRFPKSNPNDNVPLALSGDDKQFFCILLLHHFFYVKLKEFSVNPLEESQETIAPEN